MCRIGALMDRDVKILKNPEEPEQQAPDYRQMFLPAPRRVGGPCIVWGYRLDSRVVGNFARVSNP